MRDAITASETDQARSPSARRFRSWGAAGRAFVWGALLAAHAASAQTPAAKPLPELLAQQQWPQALVAIDRALKERPKDTQLLMNRGAVLSNLNRDSEALQVFRSVAAANPRLPAAHNNMAVILAAMGRYDEAKAALLLAIKAEPKYATAHENLGDLHAHQAADAYRKAVELEPGLKSAKAKLDLTADIIVLATGVKPAADAAISVPKPSPVTAAGPAAPTQPPASSAQASKVAAAATKPAASTATPVSTPETNDKSAAQVESAVRAWAKAWSRRDGARYTAAYVEDYRGGTDTAAIWRELAQKRLKDRSSIRVDLSPLNISVEGDTARVRFEQTYESDQPGSRMRTRKTLVLQQVRGRWLIREELRN